MLKMVNYKWRKKKGMAESWNKTKGSNFYNFWETQEDVKVTITYRVHPVLHLH